MKIEQLTGDEVLDAVKLYTRVLSRCSQAYGYLSPEVELMNSGSKHIFGAGAVAVESIMDATCLVKA